MQSFSTPLVTTPSGHRRLPVVQETTPRRTPARNFTADWLLSAAIAAAALFGSAPAVFAMAADWQNAGSPSDFSPPRWALILLWLSSLKAACGCYAWQWSHWMGYRVTAVALACLAGIYAAALALTLFAAPTGWLVGGAGLQLTDQLAGGRAGMWSLCLVGLTSGLAYWAANLSLHPGRLLADSRSA